MDEHIHHAGDDDTDECHDEDASQRSQVALDGVSHDAHRSESSSGNEEGGGNALHGVGHEDEGNIDYFVMEYVSGKTLKDFIVFNGKLNYTTAIEIAIQIAKALDVINCPLLEEVYMPCTYKDKDGNPMKTQECMVFPLPIKRMKQMVTKKNGMSTSINIRDERTGLLTGVDKNGKESDREFECLAISGLNNTMKELSRSRADSMGDKSAMYNTINVLGQVSLDDLPDDPTDSLSKNLLSWYFIGAQLMTNLVNEDYYFPYTLKEDNGV